MTNSLGIAALFETDRSRHELVFRYEDNGLAHKSYLGTNEVVRTHINPADYTSGRFFVLPDANITNLQVYLEDPAGTVPATSIGGAFGMFRKANLDQIAVYDLQAGTLFLREKPVGRVLVTYTKGGATVGDASLGQQCRLCSDYSRSADSGTTRSNSTGMPQRLHATELQQHDVRQWPRRRRRHPLHHRRHRLPPAVATRLLLALRAAEPVRRDRRGQQRELDGRNDCRNTGDHRASRHLLALHAFTEQKRRDHPRRQPGSRRRSGRLERPRLREPLPVRRHTARATPTSTGSAPTQSRPTPRSTS